MDGARQAARFCSTTRSAASAEDGMPLGAALLASTSPSCCVEPDPTTTTSGRPSTRSAGAPGPDERCVGGRMAMSPSPRVQVARFVQVWRSSANAPRAPVQANPRQRPRGRGVRPLPAGLLLAVAAHSAATARRAQRAIFPARAGQRGGLPHEPAPPVPPRAVLRRSFSLDDGLSRDSPTSRPSAAAGVRTGPTARRPPRPCSGPRAPAPPR